MNTNDPTKPAVPLSWKTVQGGKLVVSIAAVVTIVSTALSSDHAPAVVTVRLPVKSSDAFAGSVNRSAGARATTSAPRCRATPTA
jgi:hypothetical protein